MKYKIIRFSVRDNTNIYNLELAKSLLYFTEYDFTYFWEQCIEAGKTARKTGRLPSNIISNAKNVISKIHPFVEACMLSDFDDICTDCIIEYICQSEMISLEELWTRCITSKNLYENTIFRRISEYKANRAVNQWVNLIRMQEYARNKLAFVYDPDENGNIASKDVIRTRRDYFDLAVSVAANELGYPTKKFPSSSFCTSASLPESTFVISKVSKAIYRRYSEAFAAAGDVSLPETRDYTFSKDKLALDAYSFVKGMTRPAEIDMKFALEAILETPEEIFFPDCFKAIIDLEFNLMLKENIFIRKCVTCKRYFAVTSDSEYCDRVNSSGKTCRDIYEETIVKPEPIYNNEITAAYQNINSSSSYSEKTHYPFAQNNNNALNYTDGKENIQNWRFVKPPNQGVPVPPEMEKHGQKIYNALYKRIGLGIEENEFKEWSQYLSNMKRNVKIGEATIEQLQDFLDYSDNLAEEVKLAGKNKKNTTAASHSFYKTSEFDISAEKLSEKDETATVSTVIKAEDTVDISLHSAPIFESFDDNSDTLPSENYESKVKPFAPESFKTLADAMINERSDVRADVSYGDKEKQRAVEIKEPAWQRLTREEAYAQQERDLERYRAELEDDDDY